VKVESNADRLVTQLLAGEVWPATADRHAYRVDADGTPFVLPGMGGVTLAGHLGEPATGWASDHLEPGLSVRHADPAANYALQYLTCVGNEVTLVSGASAGGSGVAIGQHAYVLVDAADDVLEGATVGDRVTVRAHGQGLALTAHPQVRVKNLDPAVLAAMPGGTRADGRLEVHVAVDVPADAAGAGGGMASEFANTDLMGAYAGLDDSLSLGLESLRIGDLVVMRDTDHSWGRGYRPGWLTIGTISTGQCALFGHGPGPTTLLSGPAEAFHVVTDADANLSAYVAGSRRTRTEVAA
jgi:hypothetical protein